MRTLKWMCVINKKDRKENMFIFQQLGIALIKKK